jgi:NTE family protein
MLSRSKGETYWDGGYAANPPLIPLVTATRALEVLVVQIMPSAGLGKPTTSSEITRRLDQITFNGTLTRDMDALAAMRKLTSPGGGGPPLARKLQRLQLHHLAAETQVPELSQASGMNWIGTSWSSCETPVVPLPTSGSSRRP